MPGRVLWRPLWPLAKALAWAGWRLDVEGEHHVPDGPLVIAANHYSHLDPPLVGVAVRRRVRFLALEGLFGINRVYDAVMLGMGAIPIPRESKVPIRALKVALGHLALGGAVGVFPEGRRVNVWGDAEPKQGAAWLSLRTGNPLLPVAITGSELALGIGSARVTRADIRIVIGETLDPAAFSDRSAMTEAWRVWVDARIAQDP